MKSFQKKKQPVFEKPKTEQLDCPSCKRKSWIGTDRKCVCGNDNCDSINIRQKKSEW